MQDYFLQTSAMHANTPGLNARHRIRAYPVSGISA
jgi:hypothetical protein